MYFQDSDENLELLNKKVRRILDKKKEFFFRTYGRKNGKNFLNKINLVNKKLLKEFLIINRSVVKLAEINITFSLISKDRSIRFLDLCSAPGGFLDYMTIIKKYSSQGVAISLPVEDGGIPFSNLIRENTNIRREYCDIHKEICLNKILNNEKFDLILADGACVNNNILQEKSIIVDKLIEREIKIMKKHIKKNGNFILKIFEINNNIINIILENVIFFKKLFIYKPISSKATNDEKYLIFMNYNLKKNDLNKHINRSYLLLFNIIFNLKEILSFEKILNYYFNKNTINIIHNNERRRIFLFISETLNLPECKYF